MMATDFLSVFSRVSIVPEQRDADWLAAQFETLIKAFAAIWRQQHPCNLLVNHRLEKFLAHFLFSFISVFLLPHIFESESQQLLCPEVRACVAALRVHKQ